MRAFRRNSRTRLLLLFLTFVISFSSLAEIAPVVNAQDVGTPVAVEAPPQDNPGPEKEGFVSSAATVVGGWGNVYSVWLDDSYANPASTCYSDQSVGSGRVTVAGNQNLFAQLISVAVELWGVNSDNSRSWLDGDIRYSYDGYSYTRYPTFGPFGLQSPGGYEYLVTTVTVTWYRNLDVANGSQVATGAFSWEHDYYYNDYFGTVDTSCYYPELDAAISPTRGTYGTTVGVASAGFIPGERIDVFWDSTSTTRKTYYYGDIYGAGGGSFTVPSTKYGTHNVKFRGAVSGVVLTEKFSVDPVVKLSKSSGRRSTTVTVTLRGYRAGETVRIRFYNTSGTSYVTLKSGLVTSSNGYLTTTITIPSTAGYGSHRIRGYGSSGSTPSAYFTVTR